MSSLPVLLKNPNVLLLGGGAVAYQKATVLIDNNIDFKIKSLNYCDAFQSLKLQLSVGDITDVDLLAYNIIIDATGSDEVAALLQVAKEQRFLLVNRVDSPEECDFYFAALLNYGALKIAISTDGASPTVAKVVRDKIKQIIPDSVTQLVDDIARDRAAGIIDVADARRQILQQLEPRNK